MSFSIQLDSSPIDSFKSFTPTVNTRAFENLTTLQNLDVRGEFLEADKENKVFAKNWLPTLSFVKGEYQIRPMRYGLTLKEDKTYIDNKKTTISNLELQEEKYNQLLSTGRGIISIKSYFIMENSNGLFDIKEYVKENSYHFLAPIIYDNWFSEDRGQIIQSFALVIDNKSKLPFDFSFDEAASWLTQEAKIQEFKAVSLIEKPLNLDI